MITEFEIDFELLFYNFESKTKASNLIHFAKIGNHWSKTVKNGQNLSSHINELYLTFIGFKNH